MTNFTIRPFCKPELPNDPVEIQRRKEFNERHSSEYSAIKSAFGMLKGRFPALRDMPGKNRQTVYATIEALMVIHNICVDLNDDPTEIEGYRGVDNCLVSRVGTKQEPGENGLVIDRLVDEELYMAGQRRREHLMETMDI